MRISNKKLCDLINRTNTNFIFSGFDRVDSSWNGTVLSPTYSRLYYITDGKASVILKNGKQFILTPNNWYLLPSDCSFDFCCEQQMEHIFFHLKICSIDGIDLLRVCKEPICFNEQSIDVGYIIESLKRNDKLNCLYIRQLVENTIFRLLDKNNLCFEEKVFSNSVTKAIQYINSNLSLTLSLKEISKNSFVSKSTLTKYFKQELGISIHKYIFDKIMYEAEILLLQNKLTIREISEKYNFYDQFYFSRRFKNKYGISPAEYRKIKII
jgi:AraC-like DNA-binding protein